MVLRGGDGLAGFLNSTGRLGPKRFKDCPKCAPLAHPLKGHRWGTGPKRCPARARRANVPPMVVTLQNPFRKSLRSLAVAYTGGGGGTPAAAAYLSFLLHQ